MSNEYTKHTSQIGVLALKDICAVNAAAYEEKLKTLPIINKEFSILKNKRKVEPAGFMFYVKYEIETVWENQKKGIGQDAIRIEEMFLYKDKINLLNEMKCKDAEVGENKDSGKKKFDDSDSESSNENTRDGKETKKKDKTFKKGTSLVKKYIADKINVYDILGVEESDSLEKVKANYKKLILIFHPDKSKGAAVLHEGKNKKKKETKKNNENETDETNRNEETSEKNNMIYYMKKFNVEKLSEEEKKNMFLKIQDSYTILSDSDLRKQYDSSVPFDETIPTSKELEAAGNFYEFLRPIFKRNAKWSVVKPVPDIGDENTDIKTVKQFYDFWYSFTSWRDFSCQNEYDYEQAECREERRWMEKENKKIQKKAYRLENLRILKLVDLAFQRDPRLIAEKQRIQLEKQKKKEQQAILEKQKKMKVFDQNADKNANSQNNNSKTNDLNNTVNGVNGSLSGKEKLALKMWRHHIKTVCYIKLANFVKTELLAEKLLNIPFNIMCDFIYDIYVELKFDFHNFDEITQERRNQKLLKMNQKDVTENGNNLTSLPNQNGHVLENNISDLKGNDNLVNNSKTNEEMNNKTYTNGNINNIKGNNTRKGNVKSNIKNVVNKKGNNNRNKNSYQKNSAESNKPVGFLDMIKNKQFEEKELHALINIFKKYINDSDFINGNIVTPTKPNGDVSQKKTEESFQESTIQKNENGKEVAIDSNDQVHAPEEKLHDVNQQKAEEKKPLKKSQTNEIAADEKESENVHETNNENSLKWTPMEISLLSKALKTYPGGTKDRWNLIANYLKTKNVKEVIKKTKEMFENDTLKNLGKKFDETPFDHFIQANKGVMKKIEDNLDKRECISVDTEENSYDYMHKNSSINTGDKYRHNHVNEETNKPKPWTEEEQDLLEKALVKYPPTIAIKERLKLIAAEIPTRGSEEIVARLKQIRAKILAKKVDM